jgi:uncharacterized protein (DUF58 family)
MLRLTSISIPLFAAAIGLLGVWAGTSSAAGAPPTLTFRSAFTGVAADGEHCTWEGPVEGAARGRLAITLRQVEEPAEAAKPVWHVVARWTVRDDRGVHSFAANLEGMVDWKGGTIRLGGPVTDGWLEGSWVNVDGRIVDGDLAGGLSILPAVAHR